MTDLRPHRIPNRHCWPRSTGSTAFPAAPSPLETIRPILVSSSTEGGVARPMRDEDETMKIRTPVDRHRTLRLLGALAGLSVALGACTYTSGEVVPASAPADCRLGRPIALEEAARSVTIFVAHARGGLSASQRADVLGLAQIWVREGTGAILADLPFYSSFS